MSKTPATAGVLLANVESRVKRRRRLERPQRDAAKRLLVAAAQEGKIYLGFKKG